jgi:hypothetical protein
LSVLFCFVFAFMLSPDSQARRTLTLRDLSDAASRVQRKHMAQAAPFSALKLEILMMPMAENH